MRRSLGAVILKQTIRKSVYLTLTTFKVAKYTKYYKTAMFGGFVFVFAYTNLIL